jgi:hypothetical protein
MKVWILEKHMEKNSRAIKTWKKILNFLLVASGWVIKANMNWNIKFGQTLVSDLTTIDRKLKQASYMTLKDNALA